MAFIKEALDNSLLRRLRKIFIEMPIWRTKLTFFKLASSKIGISMKRFARSAKWSCSVFPKASCLCLLLLFVSGCKKTAPQVSHTQKLLEAFGAEMAKEHNLIFQGCGGSMPHTIDELEVLFEAHRKGTVEESSAIQLAGTQKLLQKINGDEYLKPYLKEVPFPSSRISLSISYSQDGKTRFTDGSVALSYKVDNQIFYFTYDPQSNSLQSL